MLATGVPNFDLILGGGVPEGDVLLVIGQARSGKTILSLQMAFHAAAAGRNVIYVSTLSEPPGKLVQHLRPYAFFDETLIGKHLFLLNIYPLVKQSLERVSDALVEAVKQHRAVLLILDGLMTLHDLHPQAVEMRAFVYDLGSALATLGVTTVITTSAAYEAASRSLPELTMADGLVENLVLMRYVEFEGELYRILSILKMRESGFDHSIRQYVVTAKGSRVLEPIETAAGVLAGIARLPAERRAKRGKGAAQGEG